jgi:hypothetical protein
MQHTDFYRIGSSSTASARLRENDRVTRNDYGSALHIAVSARFLLWCSPLYSGICMHVRRLGFTTVDRSTTMYLVRKEAGYVSILRDSSISTRLIMRVVDLFILTTTSQEVYEKDGHYHVFEHDHPNNDIWRSNDAASLQHSHLTHQCQQCSKPRPSGQE